MAGAFRYAVSGGKNMRVKWETLKEKAILVAVGNVEYVCMNAAPLALIAGVADGTFDWKTNAGKMREAVIKVVERWDVRRAKALIDLFPGIVPRRFVGMVPVCYVEDTPSADWIVEF